MSIMASGYSFSSTTDPDNNTLAYDKNGRLKIISVPPVDVSVTNPITNDGNTLGLNYDNETLNLSSGTGAPLQINLAHANTWTGVQTFPVASFNNLLSTANTWTGTQTFPVASFNNLLSTANTWTGVQTISNQLLVSPPNNINGSFIGLLANGATAISGSVNQWFFATDPSYNLLIGEGGGSTNGASILLQSATATIFSVHLSTKAVASSNNTLDDGSGNMTIAGYNKTNLTQTTLTGTTAGSVVWSQPEQGSAYKKFVAFANGYENTTATAQTITFSTAFTETPIILGNSTGMTLTASTTTLTLPASMSATATGMIIIEGY